MLQYLLKNIHILIDILPVALTVPKSVLLKEKHFNLKNFQNDWKLNLSHNSIRIRPTANQTFVTIRMA